MYVRMYIRIPEDYADANGQSFAIGHDQLEAMSQIKKLILISYSIDVITPLSTQLS